MAENYGNTKQTLEEHKTAHRQRHYNYVPFIVSRRHRTDIYLLPCVIFYYSFYLFDKIQTHHRWLQKGSRRKRDLAVEKGERERERERERGLRRVLFKGCQMKPKHTNRTQRSSHRHIGFRAHAQLYIGF